MANALMLGGGAPTLTLQSGALAALLDQGVKFDVVSTAGAGMLVGLLYAAPKGMSPRQALEHTREMGVHDAIYEHFPINYKVFHKPGRSPTPIAAGCRSCRAWFPVRPGQPVVADWMALMVRDLVPLGPVEPEPRAVRPRALDRRGGRFRQAEGVSGRVLHERLLHRRSGDEDLHQGRDHARSLPGGACLPLDLSPVQARTGRPTSRARRSTPCASRG